MKLLIITTKSLIARVNNQYLRQLIRDHKFPEATFHQQ